jgi:soluble lytic murein transglycosylase-like protein
MGKRAMPLPKQLNVGLATIGMGLCMAVSATDVYRAENPDGTFRYASQPFDASYTLYLKGDTGLLTSTPARAKSAATVPAKQTTLEPLIQKFAQKHAVDAALVRAIIEVESDFNPQAVSRKGAAGAMQLMPTTAARYGVKHQSDPAQNIEAGVRYLKDLLALHDGNIALALASYNAGAGTIAKYGRRIPPYRETMLYVPAVLIKLQNARATPIP